MVSNLNGNWSYRSLVNNPDLAIPFNDLAFGAGTIEFIVTENGELGGTLGGTGWSLALNETVNRRRRLDTSMARPWDDWRRRMGVVIHGLRRFRLEPWR